MTVVEPIPSMPGGSTENGTTNSSLLSCHDSMFKRTIESLAILTTVLLISCSHPSGPPYSPESALKTFKIEPGFRIELFASEPQISDPVAMEFDEDGRIYVVEMHGYPLDIGPSGRVKLLRDTDG